MPGLNQSDLALILPQTYPFLMLDRVDDYKEGEWLTAIKNISADEWAFSQRRWGTGEQGHNSELSFPETLVIEAAAQAALILYHVSKIKASGRRPRYFIGKVKSEFMGSAQIGDKLTINVTAGKLMDTGGYADVEISTDTAVAAKIELFFGVK